jgi:hypothetical protein
MWARQLTEKAAKATAAALKAWLKARGLARQRWYALSSHPSWDARNGVLPDEQLVRQHGTECNVKIMCVWLPDAKAKKAKVQPSRVYWHANRDRVQTVYLFRRGDQYLEYTTREADTLPTETKTPTRGKKRDRQGNTGNATSSEATQVETSHESEASDAESDSDVKPMRQYPTPPFMNERRMQHGSSMCIV